MGKFLKKIAKGIGKVGRTLGKGAGLLAKGALSLGKTVLGIGDETDTEAAKYAARASESVQQLAELQKLQLAQQNIDKKSGVGGLAGGASGSQAGFESRLKLSIVWDWIRNNWYVPALGILAVIGFFFYFGKRSVARKTKRR